MRLNCEKNTTGTRETRETLKTSSRGKHQCTLESKLTVTFVCEDTTMRNARKLREGESQKIWVITVLESQLGITRMLKQVKASFYKLHKPK